MRWAWDDEPNIPFAWSEVQVVQRLKPTSIPEEGVYFRLQRSSGELEEFVFSAGKMGTRKYSTSPRLRGRRSVMGRDVPYFEIR